MNNNNNNNNNSVSDTESLADWTSCLDVMTKVTDQECVSLTTCSNNDPIENNTSFPFLAPCLLASKSRKVSTLCFIAAAAAVPTAPASAGLGASTLLLITPQ